MKAGDIVKIFEDPYTQKMPEGEARLRKLTNTASPNVTYQGTVFSVQRWEVKFLDDGFVCERNIAIPLDEEAA